MNENYSNKIEKIALEVKNTSGTFTSGNLRENHLRAHTDFAGWIGADTSSQEEHNVVSFNGDRFSKTKSEMSYELFTLFGTG